MWMKSPTPKDLIRYFRYWGIEDIFKKITRAVHTRGALRMSLTELVDKRNAIAHGDSATAATRAEVHAYLGAVETFADRADAALSRQMAVLLETLRPW